MFWIVLLSLVVALLVLAGAFFRLVFVRREDECITDIDSAVNDFLGEHKNVVKDGMDFIKTYPYTTEEVLSFDGLTLRARYFDINSDKTIFLFHGYRSASIRDFSCAVKMYMDMGLNVLLVDQRAHGISDGKIITFGVKERRDVLSWINYYNEKTANSKKIFLGGMSMGATTVLLASGLEVPENICGIIADCGFTSPVDIIKRVARRSFKIDGNVTIFLMNLYCLAFGRFSLYGVSTLDALKKSDIPVIFIHGKADNFVPPEMSEEGFSATTSKKRILLIEEAAHGMSFLVDSEFVMQELKDFLAENS